MAVHGAVQVQEVIALQQHVVELDEAQALFQTGLEALCCQHAVDREMYADFPQEVHVIELQNPVRIVQHHCLVIFKINQTAHLLAEAFCIVVNFFLGQHLTHIGLAGGITNHGGTAADQRNRAMAGLLQASHNNQLQEMADMQGICCGIKANIERGLMVIQQVTYLFFVGALGN